MAFWLPLHKGIPLFLLLWSHWLSRGFISLDMKYFLINWWVPWKLMKFIWTYTFSCLHLILKTTAIIYWAHVHLLTLWILTTTYEIGIIPISQMTNWGRERSNNFRSITQLVFLMASLNSGSLTLLPIFITIPCFLTGQYLMENSILITWAICFSSTFLVKIPFWLCIF